jgi:arylsulfatase A-like enzyme
MVSSTDVFPTLVNSAGLSMPQDQPTDGVNLLPYITGQNKSNPHEWLAWQNRSWAPSTKGGPVKARRMVHNSAIRKGDWKLVRLNEKIGVGSAPPPWRLYNLVTDIGEQNDVSGQHAEVVNELSALFGRWRSSMRSTVE